MSAAQRRMGQLRAGQLRMGLLAAVVGSGLLFSTPILAQDDMAAPAMAEMQSDGENQARVDNNYTYPARLADKTLVLDAIAAGNRFAAVGARGHVLLSDDGEQWRQVLDVPTRATLTAVYFRGGHLWAVGHDSVIIHSADMGETWNLQYSDPEAEQPLMDVVFTDAQSGVAVGAYSLLMTTSDGGVNWEPGSMLDLVSGELGDEFAADDSDELDAGEDEFVDEGIEYHLNAILELENGSLLIAAEAGNGYRSDDGGASWYHFNLPYAGSMFGVIEESADCILTYGLRGHIQRSCDAGASWDEVTNNNQGSLFGAVKDENSVVLVGANGAVVRVTAGSARAQLEPFSSGEDLAAVLATENGLVVAGEDGISLANRGGEGAMGGMAMAGGDAEKDSGENGVSGHE